MAVPNSIEEKRVRRRRRGEGRGTIVAWILVSALPLVSCVTLDQ